VCNATEEIPVAKGRDLFGFDPRVDLCLVSEFPSPAVIGGKPIMKVAPEEKTTSRHVASRLGTLAVVYLVPKQKIMRLITGRPNVDSLLVSSWLELKPLFIDTSTFVGRNIRFRLFIHELFWGEKVFPFFHILTDEEVGARCRHRE
jgi:hypothetical protein